MDKTPASLGIPPIPRFNDCWNRIGIRGDGSCPELRSYVHCRNCPVYRAAAITLLDRTPSDDIAATWSNESASPEPVATDGGESMLIFRIGGEWLGLHSAWIQEIVEQRKMHSLPHQRNAAMLGIVNIRGALVVCMSLARLLSINSEHTGEEHRQKRHLFKPMVVISHGEHATVFPVDEVHGIHHFSPSALTPVPSTLDRAIAMYTRGILPWRDRTIGVLQCDALFHAVNRSVA
jgi:chemotaxis-related protein WspD